MKPEDYDRAKRHAKEHDLSFAGFVKSLISKHISKCAIENKSIGAVAEMNTDENNSG